MNISTYFFGCRQSYESADCVEKLSYQVCALFNLSTQPADLYDRRHPKTKLNT